MKLAEVAAEAGSPWHRRTTRRARSRPPAALGSSSVRAREARPRGCRVNRPAPRHPHAPKRERALDRLADLVRGLTPDRREALVRDVLEDGKGLPIVQTPSGLRLEERAT